jgi:hypothetical protein
MISFVLIAALLSSPIRLPNTLTLTATVGDGITLSMNQITNDSAVVTIGDASYLVVGDSFTVSEGTLIATNLDTFIFPLTALAKK